MTAAEELRGWPEAEVLGYMTGRAAAEAAIERIKGDGYAPAQPPAASAPRGETEQRASAVAEAVLAQDQAAAAVQRAVARVAPVGVRVEAPGDGPTADDRRAWAIRKMMQDAPPVLRPGGPRADLAYRLPDGTVKVARSVPQPRVIDVIRPGEVTEEQVEYRWQFRERQLMNTALATYYGLGPCVAAGIITGDDARLMELSGTVPAEPARGPAPYDLGRSVA